MPDDPLTSISARWSEATPGPWHNFAGGVTIGGVMNRFTPQDAEAISHAPEDIQFLLDEVKRLRTLVRHMHVCVKRGGPSNYEQFLVEDSLAALNASLVGAPKAET